MRPLRIRLTLSRLMIAVAIIAFALGAALWAEEMVRRSSDARKRAIQHGREARINWREYRSCLMGWVSCPIGPGTDTGSWATLYRYGGLWTVIHEMGWQAKECYRDLWKRTGRTRRLYDHHERLRRKWDRVAHFPWVRVGPDPPEPD